MPGDLLYSLRLVRKSPAFSLIVIALVALGVDRSVDIRPLLKGRSFLRVRIRLESGCSSNRAIRSSLTIPIQRR